MKHRSLSVALITTALTLAVTPTIASAADKGVDKVKRDLDKIIKAHGSTKVAKVFADIGIELPGHAGFRGLQYSEYRLSRNCWIRGPQAGLIRNDNCITYKATCATSTAMHKCLAFLKWLICEGYRPMYPDP